MYVSNGTIMTMIMLMREERKSSSLSVSQYNVDMKPQILLISVTLEMQAVVMQTMIVQELIMAATMMFEMTIMALKLMTPSLMLVILFIV